MFVEEPDGNSPIWRPGCRCQRPRALLEFGRASESSHGKLEMAGGCVRARMRAGVLLEFPRETCFLRKLIDTPPGAKGPD